jgi:hypothetical protein
MKITVRPESFLEWIGLRFGMVPVPLLETHIAASIDRIKAVRENFETV